jgi:hypothetical protein
MGRPVRDISNKQFGELTALEFINDRRWKCRCSCNSEIIARSDKLLKGTKTSCGCKTIRTADNLMKAKEALYKKNYEAVEHMQGQTYNYLTTVSYEVSKGWLCNCKCGKQTYALPYELKTDKQKSCGCIVGTNNKVEYTDKQLIDAVNKYDTLELIAGSVGLSRPNKRLKSNLKRLEVDINKYSKGFIVPVEEYFVKGDRRITGSSIKNRLHKEGILEPKCYKCGITEWNSQPAPLELEHINGDPTDNTIENLTILCPNCHAQSEWYRGKNQKRCRDKKLAQQAIPLDE